jgi:hypothetical protein
MAHSADSSLKGLDQQSAHVVADREYVVWFGVSKAIYGMLDQTLFRAGPLPTSSTVRLETDPARDSANRRQRKLVSADAPDSGANSGAGDVVPFC